ncbi:hypothetical protein NOF04DRAFT_1354665 [Fusarium oxysporum II5]|nr:hypothetical protein NOF04DRAFT_1354665 [Fusarium oxysporum II5]
MFRSKEPFGGQETIDARLIETNKGINVLSSQCVKFVKDRSDEFTNYLLYAWERDGTVILKNEELLKALQNVEVTRKDGQLSLLREFYLPLPKFVFLQARYMPPNENFKFLDLDPKLSSITLGHGHFSGLTSNKDGTVEFPRRVFELYLRWQAVYEAGGEKIRVEFYGKAPKNPPSVISGSTLLPPPKEWEVSNSELAALEKFYRETLEIMDGEVESILLEFNKELDFKRAKEVYHTLQIMEPGLAKDDAKRIRSFFKEKPRLLLSKKYPERFLSTQCVWAPKLMSRRNASETCPELESFFADLLGVPKTDIGAIYLEIVSFNRRIIVDPYDPAEEQAKRLLV